MKCPFCEQEMIEGVMSGDGRSRVYWETPGNQLSFIDVIAGKGQVKNVEYSLTKFKIKGDYCPRCKKMIFDTNISR